MPEQVTTTVEAAGQGNAAPATTTQPPEPADDVYEGEPDTGFDPNPQNLPEAEYGDDDIGVSATEEPKAETGAQPKPVETPTEVAPAGAVVETTPAESPEKPAAAAPDIAAIINELLATQPDPTAKAAAPEKQTPEKAETEVPPWRKERLPDPKVYQDPDTGDVVVEQVLPTEDGKGVETVKARYKTWAEMATSLGRATLDNRRFRLDLQHGQTTAKPPAEPVTPKPEETKPAAPVAVAPTPGPTVQPTGTPTQPSVESALPFSINKTHENEAKKFVIQEMKWRDEAVAAIDRDPRLADGTEDERQSAVEAYVAEKAKRYFAKPEGQHALDLHVAALERKDRRDWQLQDAEIVKTLGDYGRALLPQVSDVFENALLHGVQRTQMDRLVAQVLSNDRLAAAVALDWVQTAHRLVQTEQDSEKRVREARDEGYRTGFKAMQTALSERIKAAGAPGAPATDKTQRDILESRITPTVTPSPAAVPKGNGAQQRPNAKNRYGEAERWHQKMFPVAKK